MKVIKRNGNEEDFCLDNIINAIKKANKATKDNGLTPLSDEKENKVILTVQKKLEPFDKISVEDIQDMVEDSLIKHNCYDVAKSYIKFRENKKQNKKFSSDEEEIMTVLDGTNESVKQDNANKNSDFLGTQRDYMAGKKSKTIVKKTWSKRIMDLHKRGVIHVHDTDYRAMRMTNCCLINLKDMFKNGFMLNSTLIHEPSDFATACNLAAQIALHVCSSQYGGQTMSWSHISSFVKKTRIKFVNEVTEEFKLLDLNVNNEYIKKIAEERTLKEIKRGVKTFQYQILTLSGTNGQSPFISMAINFEECESKEDREDLYLVAKEVFEQRIRGIEDSHGNRVSPLFPKLLYFLDEYTSENGEYFDKLIPLILECENERMSPDFISTKVQKKLKGNNIGYPCMGSLFGEAIVSIKIGDVEYNNIEIQNAFNLIGNHIKRTVSGFSMCNRDENGHTIKPKNSLRGVCGIYKLTHLPTGKFYVGSSKDLGRRKSEHFHSMKKKGTLGDNYFVNDFDTNNLKFEVLETCNADNLLETEYKYTTHKDDNCVNVVDCRRNGNIDFDGNAHRSHGKFIQMINNRGYSYIHTVNTGDVFVKSRNEWTPVRNILKNDPEKSHFDMYEIVFENKGIVKKIICTQDHPLHTQNGRVETQCLTTDDYLFDSETYEHCKILSINKIDNECVTYDFTVDNDLFDVNGIISHNCRSFLTTEGSYFENGVEKKCNENFYGRHNNGVITINLPYVALESKKEFNNQLVDEIGLQKPLKDIFFEKLNDYLEIIYNDGFVQTYKRLKGTKAKVAPILWMWGGLTRKDSEDTIDDVITGWRSTYSLGYVGLWETTIAITEKNLIDEKEFGLSILEFFNKKHEEWHTRLMDENISNSFLNTSSYGTPEENTTEKFANALKRDFDIIEGVNDHNYVTNSYHVRPNYRIDAFHKLENEAPFLALSTGGAVSYVEIPDMKENPFVIESVINHMYNTILYSEFNIRKDKCYKCGYDSEIPLVSQNGKLIWKCPSCGNKDTKSMSILRRMCGYIANADNGVAQGRLSDINDRVLHLGSGRTQDQNGNLII